MQLDAALKVAASRVLLREHFPRRVICAPTPPSPGRPSWLRFPPHPAPRVLLRLPFALPPRAVPLVLHPASCAPLRTPRVAPCAPPPGWPALRRHVRRAHGPPVSW